MVIMVLLPLYIAKSNSYTDTRYLHNSKPPDLCGTGLTKTHSDTCDGTVLSLDLVLDLFDRLEVFNRLDPQLVCCILATSSAVVTHIEDRLTRQRQGTKDESVKPKQ
jgi:hypothetical protein